MRFCRIQGSMEISSVLITSYCCNLKYATTWNGWKVPLNASVFFFSFMNSFALNKVPTVWLECYFCSPLSAWSLIFFRSFWSLVAFKFIISFFDLSFMVSKMLMSSCLPCIIIEMFPTCIQSLCCLRDIYWILNCAEYFEEGKNEPGELPRCVGIIFVYSVWNICSHSRTTIDVSLRKKPHPGEGKPREP